MKGVLYDESKIEEMGIRRRGNVLSARRLDEYGIVSMKETYSPR